MDCTSEEYSQRLVAQYLDSTELLWCHPPNGGARNKAEGGKLKAQGCKRGVPDILIFSRPKTIEFKDRIGLAIELKRTEGGQLSKAQKQWLNDLHYQGWITAVCHGHQSAIDLINEIYGIRT